MLNLKPNRGRFWVTAVSLLALTTCNFYILTPPIHPANTQVVHPLASSPGRFNTFTAQDLTSACSDIVPFDGVYAFQNAPKGQPIMWSFGVNFQVQSPADAPVACFKLYRSNRVDRYELIYSYLIDTCTVTDAKQVIRSTPGRVTFLGGGHIECSMNLADWVQLVADGEQNPYLRVLLENFYLGAGSPRPPRSFHEYANFTMLARGATPADDPPLPALPVMSYIPQSPLPLSTPTLALTVDQGKLFLGRCMLAFAHDYYWWYDLRTGSNAHYTYGSGPPARSYPDCGEGPDSSPLTLWIRAATLSIGHDGINTFQGTLGGVLIDPTDSKPPDGGAI